MALPEKLQKAKSRLVLNQPFFGMLVLKLKFIETKSLPTMGTNGTHLYFNPDFLNKLSLQEVVGVLAHEVLHCVFHHMTRRGSREPEKWNVAADYAINAIVLESKFVLPEPHLFDEKYKNMTADHIYNLLPEPEKQQGGIGIGGVFDAGKDPNGDKEKGAGTSKGEGNDGTQLEMDWDIAVGQAAQQAKAVGNLPGGLETLIEGLLKPQVNWVEKLRNFMQFAKNDYSWSRPNRRFIASGLYLPAMHSEQVGDIVVAIDSSGSVSDKELQAFLSEISSILGDCDPTCVHFITCDTKIQSYEQYTKEDLPLKAEVPGRGGTRFSPVFEYVEKNAIEPECLIYLTDLGSNDYGDTPSYPVLWISSCDPWAGDQPPFGEITRIEVA